MPGCLSVELVEDFLDQRLDADSSAAVARHLSDCATCSELREALASDREIARELIDHVGPARRRASGARPSIPGYEIHDELHRGGQGVVYAATQTSTGRRAAVKVLLSGPWASPQERERFEREVSLAASLSHPGIVTVFDGGATAEGWNWLAMELVDGVRLDRHLDDARPSPEAGLEIFREICEAVQHAHLKGVIHRDLKPANVLVDEAGHPRVLDFGLAKEVVAAGDAPLGNTASGQFVGTLQWAAPEQLRGDPRLVDVRTDVHALGLIFFRLLTGTLPWPKDLALPDLLKAVAEVDPPRPSSLVPSVDADLDAIALKALAKEPERRYASAGELLRDVDRHRRGEPVEARGRDGWYVLRKAVRRHRVLVTAAAVTFVGLATATIVSLAYRHESEVNLVAAKKAGLEATNAAAAATAEAEKSAEVVAFMRKALESGRSLHKGKAMTMADFLEDAARELDANLPRNPRAEAVLRTSLGVTFHKLGLSEKGIVQLRKAVALHEQAGGPDDRERLEASIELGLALQAFRFRNAGEYTKLFDDVIERATRTLAATDPLIVRARLGRAMSLSALGKNKEALAVAGEIGAELDRRGESDGLPRSAAARLVSASLVTLGRLDEAAVVIQEALGRRLEDADRVQLLYLLGQARARLGRVTEAIESTQGSLALAEKLYLEDQPTPVLVRRALAACHYMAGQFAEAEPLFRRVFESDSRVPTLEASELQGAKNMYGWILHSRGDHEGGEKALREAVALSKKSGGASTPWARSSLRLLAWLLIDTSRFQEAAVIVKDLARAIPATIDARALEAINLVDLLARLAISEDSFEEAAALYERIARLEFNPIPGLTRADVLERYASVLTKLGRTGEAAEMAEHAKELRAAPR